MSRTVKIGIIGTGFVGGIHLASFQGWAHNASVVAVASPTHADKFAKEKGVPKAYRDYHEMLHDK